MPSIPTYQRTQVPSGETTGVKAPYSLAQTGEGQMWAGAEKLGASLKQLGDVMAELNIRQAKIKADREIIKGKATLDDFDNKTLQNLRETPVPAGEADPEKFYNNIIEERRKARAKIAEGIPTSQYSKDMLGNYAVSSDVEFSLKANNMAWQQIKTHSAAVLFTATEDALKRGDSQRAEEFIRKGMSNGLIPEDDGVKIIAGMKEKIDWYQGLTLAENNPTELLANIDKTDYLTNLMPDERVSLKNRAEQRIRELKALKNDEYQKTEIEMTKLLVDGNLTPDYIDEMARTDRINLNQRQAFQNILKGESATKTDDILAEKWLAGELTENDIKIAQKERNLSSNDVAAWLGRLGKGGFNIGLYDEALMKVSEVRSDKGKYEEVRQWLLNPDVATQLDTKWKEVRDDLEKAKLFSPPATSNIAIRNARGSILEAFRNQDLSSITTIMKRQEMLNAVDAMVELPPDQILKNTENLLRPLEEEKAEGYWDKFWEAMSYIPPLGYYKVGKKAISYLRDEPADKSEYENQIEQYLLNGDEEAAKDYEAKWGDKF